MEIIACEICNISMNKRNMKRHLTTKSHLNNLSKLGPEIIFEEEKIDICKDVMNLILVYSITYDNTPKKLKNMFVLEEFNIKDLCWNTNALSEIISRSKYCLGGNRYKYSCKSSMLTGFVNNESKNIILFFRYLLNRNKKFKEAFLNDSVSLYEFTSNKHVDLIFNKDCIDISIFGDEYFQCLYRNPHSIHYKNKNDNILTCEKVTSNINNMKLNWFNEEHGNKINDLIWLEQNVKKISDEVWIKLIEDKSMLKFVEKHIDNIDPDLILQYSSSYSLICKVLDSNTELQLQPSSSNKNKELTFNLLIKYKMRFHQIDYHNSAMYEMRCEYNRNGVCENHLHFKEYYSMLAKNPKIFTLDFDNYSLLKQKVLTSLYS